MTSRLSPLTSWISQAGSAQLDQPSWISRLAPYRAVPGRSGRAWRSQPPIQPVLVLGVQRPAERGAGATVDHGADQLGAEPLPPGIRDDVDVRQVGEAHAV